MNNKLDNNQHRRAHAPPVTKNSFAFNTIKLRLRVEEDVALQNSLSTLCNPGLPKLRTLLSQHSLERARSRVLVESNPIVQATCSNELRMSREVSNRGPVQSLNLTKLPPNRLTSMLMASTA